MTKFVANASGDVTETARAAAEKRDARAARRKASPLMTSTALVGVGIAVAIGAVPLMTGEARAQVIWEGDDSNNFNLGTNWVGDATPAGDTAVFDNSSTNQTPNVEDDISVTGVEFAAGAPSYTLSIDGGADNVGRLGVGAGGIVNNSANLQTINLNGGNPSLVGLQIHAGSFIGQIVVNNNSAQLQFDGASNSSSATVVNNSIMTLVNGLVEVGSVSGTGGVRFANNAGQTLQLGALNQNDLLSGSVHELGGGVGGLSKVGTGTLTLTGANTYTGGTTISAGTLQIGNGGTTGSVAGDITNNSALIFNRSNSLSYAGQISGSGALTKQGAGTLTLSGTNTYTGGTTVNAGTLVVSSAGALGTGPIEVADGTLSIAAGLTFGSGMTITTTGSVIDYGNSSDNAAVIDLDSNDTQLQVSTGTATQSGQITETTGPHGFEKIGAGALTLSGANTYTGGTTISAGTLVATNDAALGTTAAGTTVSSGATLALQGGIATGEALTLTGSGVATGGALRNISGSNTVSGAITLTAATRINSDAGLLTLSGGIGGAGQGLFVGGAGDTTISGIIATGTGAVTKDGAGTLTLTAANTNTGSTNVNGGTLAITGAGSIASSTVNIGAGELEVDGGAFQAANTNVALNTATSVLDVNGTETLGASGSLSLNNAGSTVDIAAGVTLSAGTITTVESSTINVGAGSTLAGLHNGTINNGGIVNVADGGAVTDAGAINNLATGVFNFDGDATFDSDTDDDGTGPITNDGTINLNGADGSVVDVSAASGAGSNNDLINQGDGQINVNTSDLIGIATLTNSSDGGGTAGVDINAGGLLSAGAIVNNSGGVIDNAGTLTSAAQIDNNSGATLTTTGTVNGGVVNDGTVNAAGTFNGTILNQGSGDFTVTGNLTGNAGFTNAGGSTLAVDAGATYSGLISLTQTGGAINGGAGAVITTAGAFSQSGGTTGGTIDINSGSFSQSGGATIAAGTSVSSAGAQTLSGGTIAGLLDGVGAITFQTGTTTVTGTGVINGANSLTGASGQLTNNGNVTIGAGGVTNNAGATINNAGTLTSGAVIANAGTFTNSGTANGGLNNSGTASNSGTVNGGLTNSGTYTQTAGSTNGGTTNTGTINANGGAFNGAIANNGSGAFNVGGTVTANSAFTNAGTATLTVTAGNSFTGITTLTNTSTAAVGVGVAAGATLGATTIDNQAGATLTNAGTVAANVTNAGTLNTTGTITGNVDNSGILNAAGTINGDLANLAGGTLNIGTSPGTLAIGGNLDLNAGSITNFELGQAFVAGGANNDLITVGGTTTLGGTVNLTAVGGGQVQAGYYQLIQSAGAASGSFDTVNAGAATASVYITSNNGPAAGPDNVNAFITNGDQTVQFWDGADELGNGSVDGGTGTWNPTNTNWTSNSDNSVDPLGPSGGAINDLWRGGVGIFAVTGGTVTVAGGPLDFQGLQFIVDGYTLNGSSLNMTGDVSDPTLSFINVEGAANTATINSVIAGDPGIGLSKGGAGTLVLGGVNTYDGGTVLVGGTLALTGAGTLGAATGSTTVNAGVLDLGGTSQTQSTVVLNDGLIEDGIINATTSFTQNGGVMDAETTTPLYALNDGTMSGTANADVYNQTGGLTSGTVNGGDYNLSGGSLGATGVANVDTFDLTGSGSTAAGSTVNATTSITQNGAGTTFAGTGTTATYTLVDGTVAGTATVTASTSFIQDGGLMSGTVDTALYDLNGGTMAGTANATTYDQSNGLTSGTVNGTSYLLSGGSLSGAANVTTFDLTGAGEVAAGAQVSVTDRMTQNGAGTIMAGTVTGAGGAGSVDLYELVAGEMSGTVNADLYDQTGGETSGTVNGAQYDLSGGTLTGISNSAIFNLTGQGEVTDTAQVSAATSITQDGTDTIFAGTGTTATYMLTNGTVAGTATVTASTAFVQDGGLMSGTVDTALYDLNGGTMAGTANATTYDQSNGLTSGTVNGTSYLLSGGSLSGAANVMTFDLTGAGEVAAGAQVSVTDRMTQNGAGTIMAGTVTGAGGAGSVDLYELVAGEMSGTVNAADFDQSGGTMSGAANVDTYQLTGGTLSGTATATTLFDMQAGNVTGVLAGAGQLVKAGAGTVTLSGANTYEGGTTVNAGTLALTGAGTLGSVAASTTINGGTLDLGGTTQTQANLTTTGGTLANGTFNATSTVTQTGGLVAAGTTVNTPLYAQSGGEMAGDANVDTYRLTGGTVSGTATATTLFDMQSGDVTGVLAGAADLVKSSAGTVTLTGANTYTGTTTVQAGTLAVTGAGTLASTQIDVTGGSLTTDGGALAPATSLTLTGMGDFTLTGAETIGQLSGTADTTVGLGATLTTGSSNADTIFAGVMSGAGGLTKVGTGIFTLTNQNTIGGAVAVNGGTLQMLGATNNFGSLSVGAGATFSMSGNGSATDVLNIATDLTLDGGSTVIFDVDLSDAVGLSDRILAGGTANGGGNVVFNFVDPNLGIQEDDTLVIRADTANNLNFDPANVSGLPTSGIVLYSFQQRGNGDWVLTSNVNIPAVAGIATSISSTQSLIGTVVNRPSVSFVGSIAQAEDNHCSGAFWMRGVSGVADSSIDSTSRGVTETSDTSLYYGGAQGALDFGCLQIGGDDLSINVGINGGYNFGRASQDQISPTTGIRVQSDIDFDARFAGVYAVVTKGNFFAELQGRYDQTNYTIHSPTLGISGREVDSDRYTVSGSASYGFTVGEYGIRPEVGFSYSETQTTPLTLGTGRLEFDDVTTFIGLAGVTVSRVFVLPDEVSFVRPFISGTVYHDFGDDPTSRFFDGVGPGVVPVENVTDNLGTFGEVSLGATYGRILADDNGPAKEMILSIRGDARFSKDVTSYGVTGQLRLQF
ncbi:MAG: autotransporter-associated beta strand repeat-containing protein [Rhizobiaceae bacterium]|nr:autotransporter-associated beta strand repeat-containing protein [Rhizobiaceae bacterium]MCV0405793.1 autotransporter-associated beta strand repeat-containing protein [Rhizobiaceae bacterium]